MMKIWYCVFGMSLFLMGCSVPDANPEQVNFPNITVPSVAPSPKGPVAPSENTVSQLHPSASVPPKIQIPLAKVESKVSNPDDPKEGFTFKLTPTEATVREKLDYRWTSDKGFLIQTSPSEVQWLPLATSGKNESGQAIVSVLISNGAEKQRQINFHLDIDAKGQVQVKEQTEGALPAPEKQNGTKAPDGSASKV